MPSYTKDTILPQLALAARPSGEKAWVFRYRHAGRARTLTLGAYPLLTPQAARRACQVAGALVAVGRCPATERRATAKANRVASAPIKDGVEKATAKFLRYQADRIRKSTLAETKRLLDREVLPHWAGRRLSEISRADVRALLAPIVRRGSPVTANRVLACLCGFFNWSLRSDIVTTNPCTNFEPPAVEKPRERVLDDGELAAVWHACDGLGEYGAGVKLLALTGQRRSEVFGADWSEIDLPAKLWHLPASRCKNNRSHSVPLSDAAMAILMERADSQKSAWRSERMP